MSWLIIMAGFLRYSVNLSYSMTYTEDVIPGSHDSFLDYYKGQEKPVKKIGFKISSVFV